MPDPAVRPKEERADAIRAWLALRFYRLSGWAFEWATRVEGPQPTCPDCRAWPLVNGECENCDHENELERVAREAYDEGGRDAWREAHHEFGPRHFYDPV